MQDCKSRTKGALMTPDKQEDAHYMDNDITMRAVDFTNKESLVDLLMRVQTGHISCRKAASVLQGVHNGMELCESCCEPATKSDGHGTPLCQDCYNSHINEGTES